MINSKRLIIVSVFTSIASIVLYCIILGWRIDVIEFEDLHIVLTLAEMFLILTILFVISLVLIKKGIHFNRIKKVLIFCSVILLIGSVTTICFNSVTRYDWYMPKNVAEKYPEMIQEHFPYHNIVNEDDEDFCVSHISGTSYYTFDVRGYTYEQQNIGYKAEYFESVSPFMNFKYYIEKGVISFSDLRYMDAFTKSEKITVNDVNMIVFTKENSCDIAVYIRNSNKAFYAELDNDYSNPISNEEFFATVIEQFKIAENCAKSKTFLDK